MPWDSNSSHLLFHGDDGRLVDLLLRGRRSGGDDVLRDEPPRHTQAFWRSACRCSDAEHRRHQGCEQLVGQFGSVEALGSPAICGGCSVAAAPPSSDSGCWKLVATTLLPESFGHGYLRPALP